jgi:hypothetical protein
MRREVSFLMSEGHNGARHYPLCMLWREADIARARFHSQSITTTLLLQSAVGAMFSKEGGKDFQKLIEGLTRDGEAD